MKKTIFILLSLGLFACNQKIDNINKLQIRMDSLEKQLTETYKPGFGEIMNNIQIHHAKLWFAGRNKNWKLANFYIHEIKEAIADIRKYQMERKESQWIGMINPPLDSVILAINNKNPILFKTSYSMLTKTCNDCHTATQFDFNIVTIPSVQIFNNQDFKIKQ